MIDPMSDRTDPARAAPPDGGSDRAAGRETGFVVGRVDVVWLGGAARLDFLQRMSTRRLVDLAPGEGRATAVVSDTGRMVDLVACHAGDAGAALVTTGPGAAAVVAAHLRRYVLYGDDVRVTDASGQVTVLRVVGPAAIGVVDAAVDGIVAGDAAGRGGIDRAPAGASSVAAMTPGQWRIVGPDARPVWVLRHPRPGGLEGFDVVVPAGDAARAAADRLAAAGARRWDDGAYAAARVAAGVPAFGAEYRAGEGDHANPLELGLRGVVDFDKGCYIGQEVIARLENYDKVQRRLVRLRCRARVAAGDAVSQPSAAGERARAGRVTTAVGVGATWWALALVPARWVDGKGAVVATEGGDVAAEVTAVTGA